jgi:hypothetical protein
VLVLVLLTGAAAAAAGAAGAAAVMVIFNVFGTSSVPIPVNACCAAHAQPASAHCKRRHQMAIRWLLLQDQTMSHMVSKAPPSTQMTCCHSWQKARLVTWPKTWWMTSIALPSCLEAPAGLRPWCRQLRLIRPCQALN